MKLVTLSIAVLLLIHVGGWAGQIEGRSPSAPPPPPRKKALIIGIDGCRPDALQAARAPNLSALMRAGAFSDQTQTGAITVSGPGWSSLLTGVWAEKHGVVDNSFRGARFDEFPHFFRRLKQVKPELKTASIVHWEPIHSKIVRDADLSLALPSDRAVAEKAAELLRASDTDVVFVHFDDVDHAGHSQGFDPHLPAYLEAIASVDAQIGKVLDALRARKTFAQEDWLIVVSTDHGGSGKAHGKNIAEHRTIFLIVSGPSAARGTIAGPSFIVDVPPTVLAHLGIPVDRAWRWDGHAVGLKRATEPKN